MNNSQMTDLEISFAVEVLDKMGISMDMNYNIVDEENGKLLHYNNKPIKFMSKMSDVGHDAIQFNPLRNINLANKLFNNYLRILHEYDGIYIISYGFEYSKNDNKKSLIVNVQNGDGTTSSTETYSYNNEALCYLEIASILNKEGKQDYSMYDENR